MNSLNTLISFYASANVDAKDEGGGTVIDHILHSEYDVSRNLQADAIQLLLKNNIGNNGHFNRHMEDEIGDIFDEIKDLKRRINKTRSPTKLLPFFRKSLKISRIINTIEREMNSSSVDD